MAAPNRATVEPSPSLDEQDHPTVLVERVLPRDRVADLADYEARGGGRGLAAARRLGPAAIIEELEASGLRGRGGAGFPTGTKWRTVADHASSTVPSTVVVNGAEGEPGSFKDREIIRRTPSSRVCSSQLWPSARTVR